MPINLNDITALTHDDQWQKIELVVSTGFGRHMLEKPNILHNFAAPERLMFFTT